MAGMEGNVILLPSRGEDGTLARQLYDKWESQQDVKGEIKIEAAEPSRQLKIEVS